MKYYLIVFIRKFLRFFFVFPIKPNRVFFTAYAGKQFSCNPKYVYQYLESTNSASLELIWAFNNPKDYYLNENTKVVKYKSLKYIYYVLTSKVVVENFESWSVLPKRKNQIIINTWHGGGAYKKVGVKRKDSRGFNDKNVRYKNQRVTLFVSSSDAFSQMTLRDSFLYKGEILKSGMPRNDILINKQESKAKEIKERLGLFNEKIVMVAPTFRTNSINDYINLDFSALVNSLSKESSEKWVVLYRSHYYEEHNLQENKVRILDVSKYSDMQELLLISDVLVTDYSSSMWDFSLMVKPVFLYSTDLETYVKTEREFYTPIKSWPFSYAQTIDELVNNILNFDSNSYLNEVKKHHKKLGSYEKGSASKEVGDWIINMIAKGVRK